VKIESPGDASGQYKGGSAGGGGKGLGRAADSLTAPDAKNSHAPNFLLHRLWKGTWRCGPK